MRELKFDLASLSNTGRVRTHNEDSILEPTWGRRDDGSPYCLFAVADGVGGAPGGEIASRLAIDALRARFRARSRDSILDELQASIAAANAAAYELRHRFDGEHAGSTLVVGVIWDGDCWVGNVGDSRAYLCRKNRCKQITSDHSLERDMLATTSARRARKYRHVITRSLGADGSVVADVFGPFGLRAGDTVVLCSDGLYSLVDDRQIAQCVSTMSADDAAARLVTLANERGGHDNISVVIAAVR